jgi:hypothetical protein
VLEDVAIERGAERAALDESPRIRDARVGQDVDAVRSRTALPSA